MNQNFQYKSVHEGKKPFNFTLCVETAITRRQNHMCDTTKIVKKKISIFCRSGLLVIIIITAMCTTQAYLQGQSLENDNDSQTFLSSFCGLEAVSLLLLLQCILLP